MTLKLSTLTCARTAFAVAVFQFLPTTAALAGGLETGSWRAIVVPARDLSCLHGALADEVALFGCGEECAPIPWQLDERDPTGAYVLDSGPAASADVDGGAIDGNDDLVFMWSDAAALRRSPLPGEPLCAVEMSVEVDGTVRRVYAARLPGAAPRSPLSYVEFDVAADVMRGRSVAVTFAGPTPRGLALRFGAAAGQQLLDRLKIRAEARFFGIFTLSRDEDDIESVYEAWRVGPVRILRRERKWIRLAFGYRTPYMETQTTFYRDLVQMPVQFRLNFAPSQLMSRIEVRAALDFVNLRGWRFAAPGAVPGSLTVGSIPAEVSRQIAAGVDASLLALQGADATFALLLRLGPTLQSLNKTILYIEDPANDAPERTPGQMPAIGFRLTEWGAVENGDHWFAAESYALPGGYDPHVLAAEMTVVPVVSVRPD